MNKLLLSGNVQLFIDQNLNSDTAKLSLAKPRFDGITSAELATQIISRKKAEKKLPTWFNTRGIYFPSSLSVEQTSSETTAAYKSGIVQGKTLLDLTAGFGVDDFHFAHKFSEVLSCEYDQELAEINAHNAGVLGLNNVKVLATDGVDFLNQTTQHFDVIYIDPARRNASGKVFKLEECSPNVPEIIDVLLAKGNQVLIKTAPLLDITAGLSELKNVAEIHIVSVKNECKELLWLLTAEAPEAELKIVCTTLNAKKKRFTFNQSEANVPAVYTEQLPEKYLYEPDAALLKSGAFNLIGQRYNLEKLDTHTQLYTSTTFNDVFPGRIFEIEQVFTTGEFKKLDDPQGNVVVRNYPDTAENLVKKYKIKSSKEQFLVFTQVQNLGNFVFRCKVLQY